MNTTRPNIPQTAERLFLVFAAVLVLIIGTLSYSSNAALRRYSEQAAVTRQVEDKTNELLSSLKDAETGQRGFLLTGEDRYLEPYRQALTQVSPALDTLARLEADRHRVDQEQRVERLKPLVKDKLDELAQTIELRRSQGPDAALAIVRTDRGRAAMDQIRALCSEIVAISYDLSHQQAEEARSSGNQTALIAVFGSAAIFAFLIFATLTIEKGTRRRNQLIGDLKKSEEQTRAARDWLQTTLASIGDAVIATDATGKVVFLNAVAQSLTGWTQGEAAAKPLEEIFIITNEETGATVENPVSKALREGRIVGLANHTKLTAKDGREVPIDDSAAPIRDGDGQVVGVVLVFRDVSERKKAEEETRRLAAIVESSDDAIIAKDLNGTVTSWNKGAERIFGYSAAEAVGKPISIIAADQNEMPKILERIRRGERIEHYETVRRTKNGSLIDISLTVSPLRDSEGRVVGASKIARDVTQAKQAAERLRVSEEQARQARDWLQTTLVSIGDAVITTNERGEITLLNPVAQSVTGWRSEEAAGKPLEQVFVIHSEETGRVAENPVTKVLREGRIVGLANHTELTTKDGRHIPIDDSAAPIRDSNGKIAGVVMVFRDIAERRDAERQFAAQAAELRIANAALLRANEDLNQFAFAASHDLQEPLRMITSYSQLLLKGYRGQLDGEAETCIEFITQGNKRMRSLLADLLAYTQMAGDGQDPTASLDLNHVFQTALKNCNAAIKESNAVVTSDNLPAIFGYEPHFVQLFQNLISNGLKYRGAVPPRIHVSAEKQGGFWRIAVKDNGIGIAPEYHKQIFGVFKRLHGNTIPGTGIGLAICKRVVDRYGGRIWVESQVGQGATFYFTVAETAKGASAHES